MKTLTLLRHAKSSWDDAVPRDFDRPLNAKGTRAAQAMGRHMRGAGLTFDHIIASPAVRVVETLDGVWDGYGQSLTPHWDRRVYMASAVTLLDLVRDVPAEVEQLLLVGHNPGLEDMVLMLVPDNPDDVLRDDVEEKFPTASLAVLTFKGGDWTELAPNGATLKSFTRPRDLDPSLGPDRD